MVVKSLWFSLIGNGLTWLHVGP